GARRARAGRGRGRAPRTARLRGSTGSGDRSRRTARPCAPPAPPAACRVGRRARHHLRSVPAGGRARPPDLRLALPVVVRHVREALSQRGGRTRRPKLNPTAAPKLTSPSSRPKGTAMLSRVPGGGRRVGTVTNVRTV